ncbi:MAG: hypothetical protein IKJ82_09265 [Oscillospiraceae bacterium]|nr:hypothetical protein [Oscillospiraceae bacterium]
MNAKEWDYNPSVTFGDSSPYTGEPYNNKSVCALGAYAFVFLFKINRNFS